MGVQYPLVGVPEKKTDNNYNEFLSVGAIVDVRNHGSKGACYSAAILEIQDKTAEVKWTSTGRREIVQLSDCYIMDHTTHYRRKRQKTRKIDQIGKVQFRNRQCYQDKYPTNIIVATT